MKPVYALAPIALLAALLSGCSEQDRPSPGVVTAYDPVLAFCARNLTNIQDVCDQLTSAAISTVYAHVLLGHAGGTELSIHGEFSGGGDYSWDETPVQIPEDRSYRYSLEIPRDPNCTSLPCTVEIEVSIDGELVARRAFTFI